MTDRSNRREVRNPILALDAIEKINAWPAEYRADLRELLQELSAVAHKNAWAMWLKNKAPMAAYWMATRAITGNIRRAIRK